MKEINESKLLELEHRISVLEGWKEGQQPLLESIKEDINDLKNRITGLERQMNERITALDQKVDKFREELYGEIRELDKKFNRFFLWMIGIQVTILLTIIGILFRISLM